jgi:hypothetical protein
MSPTEIFAIAVGGIVVLLICSHLSAKCLMLVQHTGYWFGKHLWKAISHKQKRLRPWTLWKLMVQFVWVGLNIFVAFYGFTSLRTAARRAGEVAMVDMGLFYLGPHLSYQADSLQLSLAQIKSLHCGITWSFMVMMIFHVIVLRPTQPIFVPSQSRQLYGVIVRCCRRRHWTNCGHDANNL